MKVNLPLLDQKYHVTEHLAQSHGIDIKIIQEKLLSLDVIESINTENDVEKNYQYLAYAAANPRDPSIFLEDIYIVLESESMDLTILTGVNTISIALARGDKYIEAHIRGDLVIGDTQINPTSLVPLLDDITDHSVFEDQTFSWSIRPQYNSESQNIDFIIKSLKLDGAYTQTINESLWQDDDFLNKLFHDNDANKIYANIFKNPSAKFPLNLLSNPIVIKYVKENNEFLGTWTHYKELFNQSNDIELKTMIKDEFFKNKNIVLALLLNSAITYDDIHESLKEDKDVVEKMVDKLYSYHTMPSIKAWLGEDFISRPANKKYFLQNFFNNLPREEKKNYLEWTHSRKSVLEYLENATSFFTDSFDYLPTNLKADKEIIIKYLSIENSQDFSRLNGIYSNLNIDLKSDWDIVRVYGQMLKQYYRVKEEVLLDAPTDKDIKSVLGYHPLLIYKSQEWQKNRDYLVYAMSLDTILGPSHEIYEDKVFLEKWMIQNINKIDNLPIEVRLKNPMLVIKYSLENNLGKNIPISLFASKEFCLKFSSELGEDNAYALKYIPKPYWSNEKIITNILKKKDSISFHFKKHAPKEILMFFEHFNVTKDYYDFFKTYRLKEKLNEKLEKNKKNVKSIKI